ncbi:MAG: carboxypeptidase-like regulatory domain-containing protein [Bacteroidota bacterium]
MKSGKYHFLLAIIITGVLFQACNKDEPNPTGIVKGIITDGSSSAALEGVRVALFDANTNQTVGNVLTTTVDGAYSFTVAGGSYYLKLAKQGYTDVPVRGSSAIPFTVTNDSELDNPVEMFVSSDTNIGWISGKLNSFDVSLLGTLVVASNGSTGYSTVADFDGNYVIYNVPADTYVVKAWKVGMNSSESGAVVTADTETAEVNLQVTNTEGVTVSGTVTFLATANLEVDVALTHPDTGETIPGLATTTSGTNYSLENVPIGVFLARASFANDGIVMDPDWIVKNGEPTVHVLENNVTRDFSVTGAVSLAAPTNDASTTIPVSTSSTPTFSWSDYSSTSDYVIEVSDANGNVIWGGFTEFWAAKNIVIPSSQTSIDFNSDGNASAGLESGKVYRWRIYASKDNVQSPTGWELISVSEDQRGLIIIE